MIVHRPTARPARAFAAWRQVVARIGSVCDVCRAHGGERICETCLGRWTDPSAHRCRVCAIRLASTLAPVCGACLRAPPPFDATVAAVDYGFPWDHLIARFKFHDALDLAPALAALLVAAVRAANAPLPDFVLPVPLSPARLAERGHNQAWELARRAAAELGCPADARLLLRLRDTPHQLALAPDRRAANVKGAFAVEPARLAELRGRHVALVDDVMTSGATLAALAAVSKAAGATRVSAWVVARTPPPSDR